MSVILLLDPLSCTNTVKLCSFDKFSLDDCEHSFGYDILIRAILHAEGSLNTKFFGCFIERLGFKLASAAYR